MQLIQKISLDFAENGIPPKIVGKQDDSGASRSVVISLYNAGAAFEIPSGAAFMLRYKTPSGAYGLYDTMPDGSAAMTAEENRVTVQLVDQIFAAPGRVSCELRIIADGAGVSTWKWYVDVEGSNAADATIPSDYINVLTNLASEVAANASRAEQAASQIVPESLLHKEDYDPTGAVIAAGGIAKYVENNSQSEPDLFIINLTYLNNTYSSDHTFEEIYTAFNSGKVCIAKYNDIIFLLRGISNSYVLFAAAPSDTKQAHTVVITSGNAITVISKVYMAESDLSSSVSSDSTITPANSAAVKTAYDLAKEAKTFTVLSNTISVSDALKLSNLTLVSRYIAKIGNMINLNLSVSAGVTTTSKYFAFELRGHPKYLGGNPVLAAIRVGSDRLVGVASITPITGTDNVEYLYLYAKLFDAYTTAETKTFDISFAYPTSE